MPYLGEKIKKLGFGMMRLPEKDGAIDIEQVKEMTDLFMEAGFTYFDTAWAYNGSEDAVRQVLVERYPRESFQLATKNAAWINCKNREDAIAQFDVSLERTGAGYFDFYLLHNLGESRTRYFGEFGMWSWIQEKKAEGKIQSRACYEVARKHGKPVVIMEPVKGGMLATPPESVVEILKETEPDSSPASWAIRFAADLEGVITVLSGMSNTEQMKDNLSYMREFSKLTSVQKETIEKAQEALAKMPLIPCTSCNYCTKVCPQNIGISGSFTAMNYLTLYGSKERAKGQEGWLVGRHGKAQADKCMKCGKCEQVCPQHIAIRENLDLVCRELLQ